MGKKYIIEINDEDRVVNGHISIPFELSVEGLPGKVGFSYTIKNKLIPYTEPDMEQVRKEAYDKGYDDATAEIGSDEQAIAEKAYQKGLSDAWDAARKIAVMPDGKLEAIFGTSYFTKIFTDYSASEAIEKIRQYEQEKEEIKVGDEVEFDDGETAIWMCDNPNEDAVYLMFSDGSCGSHKNSEIVRKTGRHFSEIAEVLKKMREE